MPFRKFSKRYAPRKSDKHEITWSNIAQDASIVQTVTLALGVDSASKNINTECETGSHIYGIYLEFHFSPNNTTSVKIVHWSVQQLLQGQSSTSPSTYYQNTRSQIIQRGMEMLQPNTANIVKRIVFVSIPKKMRRIAQGTSLVFNYTCSSAETINACGIAIYKELY